MAVMMAVAFLQAKAGHADLRLYPRVTYRMGYLALRLQLGRRPLNVPMVALQRGSPTCSASFHPTQVRQRVALHCRRQPAGPRSFDYDACYHWLMRIVNVNMYTWFLDR